MSTAVAEKLLGYEVPRIYTPPLRELTPETSHGFAAIAFAERVLGMRLFPWQKWLLIHALELNPDGSYRFKFVVVEVARQAGKSFLLTILALWHLYCLDSRQVIGTAQDLARADRAWEEAVEMAKDHPDLGPLIHKINHGHPRWMRLSKTDETPWFREYRVAASHRRGARGFSGDLILLDELREQTSWDSWSAISNTMNARPDAQAWAFSNAGDAMSVVLRYLRALAHRSLDWPDGDADADILDALDQEMEQFLAEEADEEVLGWFEWSASPTARRTDRQAWAQANPSLNHTEITPDCVTERTIAAALRTNPPSQFEIEVLCRWLSMAEAGPFPEGSWKATLDPLARPVPGAQSILGIDMPWNRSKVHIARAALDENDQPVFGIAASMPADRLVEWLKAQAGTYRGVVMQTGAGVPAASLLPDLEAADIAVTKCDGANVGIATGKMFDLLRDGKCRHLPHPGLDAAATTASIKILSGGAWVIDRLKSVTDAAPLQAAIEAVWGLGSVETPFVSAYAGRELIVL